MLSMSRLGDADADVAAEVQVRPGRVDAGSPGEQLCLRPTLDGPDTHPDLCSTESSGRASRFGSKL
jgi:hypothetical protein